MTAISLDGKDARGNSVFVEQHWRTMKYADVRSSLGHGLSSYGHRSAGISPSTVLSDRICSTTVGRRIRFLHHLQAVQLAASARRVLAE